MILETAPARIRNKRQEIRDTGFFIIKYIKTAIIPSHKTQKIKDGKGIPKEMPELQIENPPE